MSVSGLSVLRGGVGGFPLSLVLGSLVRSTPLDELLAEFPTVTGGPAFSSLPLRGSHAMAGTESASTRDVPGFEGPVCNPGRSPRYGISAFCS